MELIVTRGTLQFTCEEFERVFGAASAVVLLPENGDLWILPIHEAAIGGHLVKRRNAAGDRAIDVLELLRTHRSREEQHVHATWSDERGALHVAGILS